MCSYFTSAVTKGGPPERKAMSHFGSAVNKCQRQLSVHAVDMTETAWYPVYKANRCNCSEH